MTEHELLTFSQRNRIRCESPNGFNHPLASWTLSDWMTACAGELGEAANIIKKLNRCRDGIPGNDTSEELLRRNLADEIADTAIYIDLLAQAAGIDLEAARESKFAITSAKIGYVEPPPPLDRYAALPAAAAPQEGEGKEEKPERPPMLLAIINPGWSPLWLIRREHEQRWRYTDSCWLSRDIFSIDRKRSDPEALRLYDADTAPVAEPE